MTLDLKRPLHWLTENHPRLVQDLAALVAIPSISTDGEHQQEIDRTAALTCEQMRAAGLSARRGPQILGAGRGPLLLPALSPIAPARHRRSMSELCRHQSSRVAGGGAPCRHTFRAPGAGELGAPTASCSRSARRHQTEGVSPPAWAAEASILQRLTNGCSGRRCAPLILCVRRRRLLVT